MSKYDIRFQFECKSKTSNVKIAAMVVILDPIGPILAIFFYYLQVTPMLPTKFRVKADDGH